MRPTYIHPIFPWFRRRMTEQDHALVADLKARGFQVLGHAAAPDGPFTARVHTEDRTFVGVGSKPSEALSRLAEKLGEVAA